jgi:hypothetical protein
LANPCIMRLCQRSSKTGPRGGSHVRGDPLPLRLLEKKKRIAHVEIRAGDDPTLWLWLENISDYSVLVSRSASDRTSRLRSDAAHHVPNTGIGQPNASPVLRDSYRWASRRSKEARCYSCWLFLSSCPFHDNWSQRRSGPLQVFHNSCAASEADLCCIIASTKTRLVSRFKDVCSESGAQKAARTAPYCRLVALPALLPVRRLLFFRSHPTIPPIVTLSQAATRVAYRKCTAISASPGRAAFAMVFSGRPP